MGRRRWSGVFALASLTVWATSGAAAQDVTTGGALIVPEQVGAPFAARWPNEYYPRNVWDMQVFNGFLYLGAGNSSNLGPSRNAGPVPVVRYDGARFERVFTVDDEQVDIFRVFGQNMYLPGHDGRQSWDFGSLYKTDGASWEAFRRLPNGIHVYDVFVRHGRLLAVGGARNQAIDAWVAESAEGPWAPASFRDNPSLAEYLGGSGPLLPRRNGRLVSLFELGGTLYASGMQRLERANGAPGHYALATLYEVDDAFGLTPVSLLAARMSETGVITERYGADLFPGADLRIGGAEGVPQVRRAALWRTWTVYIGALSRNDHQWIPIGVFAASSPDNVRALAAPASAEVYDLLAREDDLYALANVRLDEGSFEVQLLKLRDDGLGFDTVFRFQAPAFARSFEYYKGDWYFALGSELSLEETRLGPAQTARVNWSQRLSAQTGSIWRVRGPEAEVAQ